MARKFKSATHEIGVALGPILDKALKELLAPTDLEPSEAHKLIASARWPAVITTNYDRLLPLSLPNYPTATWQDKGQLGSWLQTGERHLSMLHGSLDKPGSIVLTPESYRRVVYNSAVRTYLRDQLSRYSMLFIGFGLGDDYLNNFLEDLDEAFGPREIPHFALIPQGEWNDVDTAFFLDNYGIQAITYDSREEHAQVDELLRRAVGCLPTSALVNPATKIESLLATESQRATMTTDDYLAQFRDQCAMLAEEGFPKTAWLELRSELHRCGTASLAEKTDAQVTLLKLQLMASSVDVTEPEFEELYRLTRAADAPPDVKCRAVGIVFRILLDNYDLRTAEDTLRIAESLPIPTQELQAMREEVVLAEYLDTGSLPDLSDVLSPHLICAKAEHDAMNGDMYDALNRLTKLAGQATAEGRFEDACTIRDRRAQILLLDCQYEEAWAEFELIRLIESNVSPARRWMYMRNRQFVAAWTGNSVQQDRTIGQDTQDTSNAELSHQRDLVEAEMASRKNKLYESLPPLWRDLERAYREGTWWRRKRAHERLAVEVCVAGDYQTAIHHVFRSGDVKLCGLLAGKLEEWCERDAIDRAVSYALRRCSLTSQVEAAGNLLKLIADVIPDDRIEAVVEWILRVGRRDTEDRSVERAIIEVWGVAVRISSRLDEHQAERLIKVAEAHPFLDKRCWGRGAVVAAVGALVGRVANYDFVALALRVLPLATTGRWDADVRKILSTLARIADRCNEAKATIAGVLFPKNVAMRVDLLLLRLFPDFGRTVEPHSIGELAARVAELLPRQVWFGEGAPPAFGLSSSMSIAFSGKDQTRVEVGGGGLELDAIARLAGQIPQEAIDEVHQVVICLLRHPKNRRENRIMLADFLYETCDYLTPERKAEAIAVLSPLAAGEGLISATDSPEARSTERFQFNGPSPSELQAVALRATVALSDSVLSELIGAGLLHKDTMVRIAACSSISPSCCSESTLLVNLLTATQDPQPDVCVAAMYKCAQLYEAEYMRSHEDILTGITRRAATSTVPKVRQSAVRLARILVGGNAAGSDQLGQVLEAAEQDLYFSVRRAASAA